MATTKNDYTDYKDMLMDKVKENYLSIALGFLVFLVAVTLIFKSAGNITTDDTANSDQNAMNNAQEKKYTVKAGDSVSSIAREQLGSMEYAQAIIEANNITNPNQIEVGQELTLPSVEGLKKTTETTPEPSMTTSPTAMVKGEESMTEEDADLNGDGAQTQKVTITGTSYKVKKGDYLMDIAMKAYGDASMYREIMRANNIWNADDIEAGMVLKLPRNTK